MVVLNSDFVLFCDIFRYATDLKVFDSRFFRSYRFLRCFQPFVLFSWPIIFVRFSSKGKIKITAQLDHVSSNATAFSQTFKLPSSKVDRKCTGISFSCSWSAIRTNFKMQLITNLFSFNPLLPCKLPRILFFKFIPHQSSPTSSSSSMILSEFVLSVIISPFSR